ncbi:MAG: hypothetical protein R3290_11085, partial [Acidimicrobiia bacterium]|nr:hypothetical protein [Acidimicrobiia bacterium]
MTLALAAGWLGSVLVGSGPRRRLLGGVAGAALVVAPGLAVLAGIAGGAAWVKGRLAGRRHGAERVEVDVAVLADLV